MKIFCVTNRHQVNPLTPKLVVGSEYVPTEQRQFDGGVYYQLAEYPPEFIGGEKRMYYFHSKGFAILPEQSADQMQEENREAILNLETTIV